MSGPALRKQDSHNAIHESAYGEAEELTNLLRQLLQEEEWDKAQALVSVILEHWHTRTLAHANEEEHGLYEELLSVSAELKSKIDGLKRDHHLLRTLVEEIEADLGALATDMGSALREESLHRIWVKCQTLLWVNRTHSRCEEELLA